MKSRGHVSVIIPAYNAANFLPQALTSVFNQTHPPSEIIVVDDGSTDDTPRVLGTFREKIIHIREPRPSGGPGRPRNRGILTSSCEWIALLDDDDELMPEHLELQWAMAERTGADLVFSDLSVQCPDKLWPSWMAKVGINPRFSAIIQEGVVPNPFEHLLTLGCFIVPSTVLVRRSCLLDAGLFDPDLPGRDDYDLWLRLALKYRFAFNPGTTVVRWEHSSNLSLQGLTVTGAMLKLWEKVERIQQVREDPRRRRLVRRKKAEALWERGYMLLDKPAAFQSPRQDFARSFHTWPTTVAAAFWLASLLPPVWLSSLRRWRRDSPLITRLLSRVACPPRA